MNWLKLLRLYFPALLAAFLSLICALIVSLLSGNSMIRGFYQAMIWLPVAGMVYAFILGAWTTYRCRQAELGLGPTCPYCGGPLGPEKQGRYSLHRTCMACGKHANERHYR